MGPKEKEYLDFVNKIVAVKLKKNNLELLMNYPEFADVDVTTIKAIAMDVRIVDSQTDMESNEYEVVDITFSLGNEEEVCMSFDTNHGFYGIYNLDNYWIEFSTFDGTKLNLNNDKESKFLWLEELLKDDGFAITITSWEEVEDAFREVCERNLPSLQEVQQLTADIVRVESAGIEDILLTFSSGKKLRVEATHLRATLFSYKPL